MLSTTTVHACPHRGGARLQKNGYTQRGAQRALCLDCQCTLTLSPKGPRCDRPFKDQVVLACQGRMSTQGIKRTFGVCYQTLIKWVEGKWPPCPPAQTRSCPAKRATVLALDELWSVAEKIQQVWPWLTLCRRILQIVAYTISDRS